jgi:hypothetical protein
MRYVAEGVRSLWQELHPLWEAVVPWFDPSVALLNRAQRQGEWTALLDLLDERAPCATTGLQGQIQMLSKQIRVALPHPLLFARRLDAMQEQASQPLGPEAVALLAWVWPRRAILGPTPKVLLPDAALAWRAAAPDLLDAWAQAVRASSAVENWHRLVRPHVAVHRQLSAEMLALLAVWRNHQMAPRGLPEGLSPFQRTGSTPSESTWLAAFGSSCLTVHIVTWF